MIEHGLPKGWSITTIGECVDRLQYGYTAKSQHGADGIRFLRITDITDHGIAWGSVPACEISLDKEEKYLLQDGDLVFARTGSIEKAWRVKNPPRAVFASYLIRGRPLDRDLGRWLEYFVKTSDYVSQAFGASAGIGRANLNAKNLGKIHLAIAPPKEQHRIIETIETNLTKLAAAVAALKMIKANLKRYRASVLKAAVEGRLVPTEAELTRKEGRDYEPASRLLERILNERRRRWEEAELAKMTAKGKVPKNDKWKEKYREPKAPETTNLPELPEGWCWVNPEQICEFIIDCPHSTPKWTESGKLCVRTTNFNPGLLDLREVRYVSNETFENRIQRLKPQPGDILYSREGGILGIACMIPESTELCLGQRMMLLRVSSFASARYLMNAMNSPLILRVVKKLTGGSAAPHLNVGDVKQFPIPLPPKDEAERIVSEIDVKQSYYDSLGGLLDSSACRTKQLRQSVLKWAFEGKLVDQDPSDEPASVLLERIKAEQEAAQPMKMNRGGRRKRKASNKKA